MTFILPFDLQDFKPRPHVNIYKAAELSKAIAVNVQMDMLTRDDWGRMIINGEHKTHQLAEMHGTHFR